MKQTLSKFITVVAVVLLLAPLEPVAQQAAKIPTIGYLSPSAARNPISDAFEQSLRDLGWVRNQNIRIEERYWAGRPDALASLAGELVGLGVDVLVVWSPPGALAAKRLTNQISVVFLATADPVRFGLVSSLARPGGNLTGVSYDVSPEIYGKRLEILKEAVPGLARVALLVPSDARAQLQDTRAVMAAANKALKLEVQEVEVRAPADLEAAVRKAKQQGVQALFVWTSGPFDFGRQFSELTIAHRLPSMHLFRESAMAGGLLSYAPSLADIARRGAGYVDRILKGARPADLPVEQPIKLELVVNLKTAKALGLKIPQSLLLRADHVVE